MIEISSAHIRRLGDEDLRILVIRLCEAELRRCGLPLSSLTAGGDQNAADGGIDVRIDLKVGSSCLDFIPRPITGFQVKCSDMPPKAITKEMRPGGELRASIVALAANQGSYVIVSSEDTTSDTALQNRRKAMQEAITDLLDGANLHLDFYDRERLATWIRSYPGVGLWLRERIGEPLSGWRGYGNWTSGDLPDSEYLLDDTGRVISQQSSGEPLSVEQGIAAMRRILASPGGIIRFTGLSGVGKTRLVQALFDSRLGTDALDSAIVAYTDQGLEPNPTARDMLHRLGANNVRSIVVVDNCNPSSHRMLTQVVREYKNILSLVTVEYDVADDEPEETQVFSLEPASEKVLVDILGRSAPNVSQADRCRIADFAGGNARIALALAGTIHHHESLGILNDTALFERLFHQNQERNVSLMRAAEACSLVYSFDGEAMEGNAAELPILAEIADLSPKELFRHVEELRARDLIQRRGHWRAVLPQAVANRLACQALERIPTDEIVASLTQEGKERLLRSFSRRLSYLHDSEPAIRIAENWLRNWLADPAHLNELGVTLFLNLAPLAPHLALQLLEAAALGENGATFLSTRSWSHSRWATLLRNLAFEPRLFDRSTLLLARFVAAEPTHSNFTFRELFHLYLSGTHALAEQRLALIRRLFESEDPRLQSCAYEALEAMLEADTFISTHEFSFGARSRDYGWRPKTQNELAAWFRGALTLAHELALTSCPHQQRIKSALARRLRMLIGRVGLPDELERLTKYLAAQDGWPDGWMVIRRILRLDVNQMPQELVQSLRSLEAELRPRDLIQKVHTYVLSSSRLELAESEEGEDDTSGIQKRWERISQVIEELGREAAAMPDVLTQLLPKLLRSGSGQHWPFGRGLAFGTSDLRALWQQFRSFLTTLSTTEQNVLLLQGFIAAAMSRDSGAANKLLDEAVTDPILGPYFPLLQTSGQLDSVGADRLIASQKVGLAPASAYRNLTSDSISVATYKGIVLGIADLSDGFSVAVDLLAMHLYSLKSQKIDLDERTISLGRELLARLDFQEYSDDLSYHLSEIATSCLQGPDAYDTTLNLCTKFAHSLSNYSTKAWNYAELAGVLFHLQPHVALDTFLSNDGEHGYTPLSLLFGVEMGSPVQRATPEALLTWADRDAADRYPKLASEISLFERCEDTPELDWTPLALHLLKQAPDLTRILEIFSERLRPSSWSGSFADTLSPYLGVVRKLADIGHPSPLVASWIQREEDRLIRQIEEERQRERRVHLSFE